MSSWTREDPIDHGRHQRLLGAEVVRHDAGTHPGSARDPGEADPVDPVVDDAVLDGIEDLLAAQRGQAGPAPGARGPRARRG